MIIGVPKEIKTEEYRVGLTPQSVRELTNAGHQVIVEHNAGAGIGCTNEDYIAAGAVIRHTPEQVYAEADMIVKVKEPQASEYALIREGQILFTYLHLAPDLKQAEALMKANCIAIAYETVTGPLGGLPLLSPMSQVAGRLAIQAGAHCLEKHQGGSGILLGGVPGVYPGHVVVIGGGVVGTNAVSMAIGKRARVTVIDKSLARLQQLDAQFSGQLNTVFSTDASIEEQVLKADLVVGAVLSPGAQAPKLVGPELLAQMRPGSVLVDVSIDQGGCFATSRPTTHREPTYVIDSIVHYCVTNMPGAVPRTSTYALNNATLPFVLALANKGYREALRDDPHLLNGLNVYNGQITHAAVAAALQKTHLPAVEVVA